MTLSDIFNKLLCDEPVQALIAPREYATLRVALLRKFKLLNEQYQSVGINAYTDSYLQCTHDTATSIATFKIAPNTERKRRAADYSVL